MGLPTISANPSLDILVFSALLAGKADASVVERRHKLTQTQIACEKTERFRESSAPRQRPGALRWLMDVEPVTVVDASGAYTSVSKALTNLGMEFTVHSVWTRSLSSCDKGKKGCYDVAIRPTDSVGSDAKQCREKRMLSNFSTMRVRMLGVASVYKAQMRGTQELGTSDFHLSFGGQCGITKRYLRLNRGFVPEQH